MRTAYSVSKTAVGCALALTAAAVIATAARAAPGDPDTNFAASANAPLHSTMMQPDGKIVIGGWFEQVSGTSRYYVARLNTDGSLDSNFNASANTYLYNTGVQPDGKIVMVGGFKQANGASRYYLARLHADGSLDAGFDPGANNEIYSLILQPDGKIVIAGAFTEAGDTNRNRIARFNGDGSPDTAFNPDANGSVNTMALQGDGKIVIGGTFTRVGGTNRQYIARLNTNGSLDTAFDPGANNEVRCLAVQADGKIVAGGWFTQMCGTNRSCMARLNPDGSLDGTFDPGPDSQVYGIVLQADGRILVEGWYNQIAGVSQRYLARLNTNGTYDSTFSSSPNGEVTSMTLQPDGKVVIGGQFTSIGSSSWNYVARLNNDAATQSLAVVDADSIEWLRGGTAPEAQNVWFDLSRDGGATWTPLGAGVRMPGGWQLTGQSLPIAGIVKASARTMGGPFSGSQGLVASVWSYSLAQPDARLGTNKVVTLGDDVYSLKAADQKLNVAVARGGGKATVFIGIENDGAVADNIRVQGGAGNASFLVTYLCGGTNVTERVQAGTFKTGVLAPGALCLLKAKITAVTALPNVTRNFNILATSRGDTNRTDRVRIAARSY